MPAVGRPVALCSASSGENPTHALRSTLSRPRHLRTEPMSSPPREKRLAFMSDTLSAAALSQEPSESDMLYALSMAERRAIQETTDQDATVERVPGTPAPTLPGESPPGPARRRILRRWTKRSWRRTDWGWRGSTTYWRDVAFRRLQAEQGVRSAHSGTRGWPAHHSA